MNPNFISFSFINYSKNMLNTLKQGLLLIDCNTDINETCVDLQKFGMMVVLPEIAQLTICALPKGY
jgi:hypothetical protein